MSDLPPPGGPPPPPQFPAGPPLAPPPPPVPPGSVPPGGFGLPMPPPPAEEPGRRVAPWVVVVGILAVLGLLGTTVLALTSSDDGDGDDERAGAFERDDTTTTEPEEEDDEEAPTTTAAPAPQDLATVVDEIEAFVAEARGLPFLREVTVTLLDDAQFEARLLEDFEEEVDELVVTGQVLQAVGLVEPGLDMVAAVRTLLGAGVVGTYDPETDELLVRGAEVTPYVRTVIAHELVHALDDQHFELHRPAMEDAPDESSYGFTALVEGNASRIEDAYRAEALTPEEQDQADDEELTIGADTDLSAIPFVLLESLYAPYLLGPALVEAILEAGGQPRLDAAFATPPVTSEALLDPETYLDGQTAVPVPPPAPDGEEIDRHQLGALGLAQVIGESSIVFGGGAGGEAVEGWGGDQYVAWLDGARACVRANLVGDTPQDTAEIAEALRRFAADPPFDVEATVEATADLVTLTSCG